MKKPIVAVIKCRDYSETNVSNAVSRGISLIGGISLLFDKNDRIILKPNLLIAKKSENCVTTHPAVFEAVAKELKNQGFSLSCGDSPAVISTMKRALKLSGIAAAADKLSIPAADFSHGKWVNFPGGKQSKKLFLAEAVDNNTAVVSLPKLKTHGLTRITGAVKNQFGCVPGVMKGNYHARFPDIYDFSRMLVDITACVNPKLYIMDAVYSMEGNGPQSGTPRNTGFLIFSTDPVAMDSAACRLINLDPAFVPTNTEGAESGLGIMDFDKIELKGDPIEELMDPSFNVVRKPVVRYPSGKLSRLIKNLTTHRPVISKSRCVKCGKCVTACPVKPKALELNKNKSPYPQYDYSKCIRCFCCQEVCPEGAIKIRLPLIGKIIPLFGFASLLLTKINSKKTHDK